MSLEHTPAARLTPLLVDAASMGTTTFNQLVNAIKTNKDIKTCLSIYEYLDPKSRNAVDFLRDSYLEQRQLRQAWLLNGSMAYWQAWQDGAPLGACACCAAIHALMVERGVLS